MHAQIYLQVMGNSDFLIPLNGLSAGKTVYRWTAGKEFFEEFGNSEILDADLDIEAVVEKSGQYIGVNCHISGSLTVECDRCLAELVIPVDVVERFSVKFGRDTGIGLDEDGREIIFVSSDDTDMDMRQIVYDYAYLEVPLQKVHEEGGCDPEMISRLGMTASEDPASEKSPFSALKDIFNS